MAIPLIGVFLYIWTFVYVNCDQHVLLDTTKETMLDWTRYPYGPKSPNPGWVEESFTNFDKGINWRSYVVCDVGLQNVNNWLWTPFIKRRDANRIFIEIKFSMRNCNLFPGKAVQCKETFSLLYYEFDVATREPLPWEPESYKQIDVIAADEGRITNNDEVIINTETRSIEVTNKGVYFAFRDQGACLSLLAVKVYYLKCPEITVGFAKYPSTATGAKLTDIVQKSGTCINNAVAVQKLNNICKADGSWSFHSGLCSCVSGYEAANSETACKRCPIGKYKHNSGNEKCKICPPHSQALSEGAVECQCNKGYYRSPNDSKSTGCTRPPSAPQNLKYEVINPSTIRLSWSPPFDEGARSDTKYRITCDICSPSVAFNPSNQLLRQNNVLVSGLEEGIHYNFQVFAQNGVSSFARVNYNSSSFISVETGNSISSGISNIRSEILGPTQIALSWEADPNQHNEVYEVIYYIIGTNKTHNVITKKVRTEIKDLQKDANYAFQVRAKSPKGWGKLSRPLNIQTLDNKDPVIKGGELDESSTGEIVSVVIGVILLLTLCVLLVAFLVRRRKNNKHVSQVNDHLDYRGIDHTCANDSYPIVQTVTPIYNPVTLHKTYIDPHTYEDPNAAVKQFAKEIDSKYITIEAIIGGGEFGEVCRGRLSIPDRNHMLVAIKTLKSGSSEKAKIDFLTEASIMGQFEHPNVIFLQGVVTKVNPIMIITEYMENGSLDTFLRANDGKFQIMQLVGMMRGIAYGMQYLAEMNYVHRDLAARNVLVNSQLVCKIADFGLSREILDSNVDGAYTTRGGKIPVRWTAPEAIAFRKFTSSSDVWSFGIVMWEVMSYGERPYWNWSNQDVIKAIEKGYRLPAPMDCPEAIHQLMLDAWQKERSHRPNFVSVVKTLDKLICCPETLRKIATSPIHNPYTSDGPDASSFRSVDEWLTSIKMSRYSESFRLAGIVEMDQVVKLTLQQISDLGVTLAGHQKKLMSSIQAMRALMTANMSEGFLV